MHARLSFTRGGGWLWEEIPSGADPHSYCLAALENWKITGPDAAESPDPYIVEYAEWGERGARLPGPNRYEFEPLGTVYPPLPDALTGLETPVESITPAFAHTCRLGQTPPGANYPVEGGGEVSFTTTPDIATVREAGYEVVLLTREPPEGASGASVVTINGNARARLLGGSTGLLFPMPRGGVETFIFGVYDRQGGSETDPDSWAFHAQIEVPYTAPADSPPEPGVTLAGYEFIDGERYERWEWGPVPGAYEAGPLGSIPTTDINFCGRWVVQVNGGVETTTRQTGEFGGFALLHYPLPGSVRTPGGEGSSCVQVWNAGIDGSRSSLWARSVVWQAHESTGVVTVNATMTAECVPTDGEDDQYERETLRRVVPALLALALLLAVIAAALENIAGNVTGNALGTLAQNAMAARTRHAAVRKAAQEAAEAAAGVAARRKAAQDAANAGERAAQASWDAYRAQANSLLTAEERAAAAAASRREVSAAAVEVQMRANALGGF